jgi:hypothetical protein
MCPRQGAQRNSNEFLRDPRVKKQLFLQDHEFFVEQASKAFGVFSHNLYEFGCGQQKSSPLVATAMNGGDQSGFFHFTQFQTYGSIGVFGVVKNSLERSNAFLLANPVAMRSKHAVQ